MKLKYIFLLPVLFAAACRVSKDVSTPTSAIPEQFRHAPENGDTTSIAAIQWKQFFTNSTLQQLIAKALVKNNDLLVAVQNMEIAEQSLRQARMSLLPTATLNASAGTNFPSQNSLNGLSASNFLGTDHIEDYTVSLGVSWEADIWGKVRNRKRGALAAYLQTDEARKAIQTGIIATIAQTYYSLLTLDEQLVIAKRNLSLNDSTLFVIRLQLEAGQVTSLAAEQAEAQRLIASQLIPELEQNIEIRENALSILTGEAPHAIERNDRIGAIAFSENLPAGVPASLVSNRPDVKRAELALTAANAKVGLAKADFYPALTISATGGVNAFKASNWFNLPGSLFGTAAGAIAQPILQRRQIRTQYEIAKAERERTVIQFRQSVLTAVGEVSDALVKIDKLDAQYKAATDRVAVLQKATRDASLLFNSGMATYLEVITAQGNALQSELALANVKLTQLNAVTELYRALGGGWR